MNQTVGPDPLVQLRSQCLQRGVMGIRDFGRMFRIWDDNGDRKLSLEELTNGVKEFGAALDNAQVQQLFQVLDTDGSGSINFDELLIALRPPMSKARINLIHSAFRKMDKNGDGVITAQDLKGVYSVRNHPKYLNGQMTEDDVLQEFLKTFDSPNGDGKITLEEFEIYYATVSASIDSDAYFDLMMRQAWKL